MASETTRLGFGCASLYGLPAKRDRLALLDAAYDFGIRHFDVAPIYGLGLAETELAQSLRHRDDVVLATKFGMRPTGVGRAIGRCQSPIRKVLDRSSGLKRKVKSSSGTRRGLSPDRILYTSHDYSAQNACRSLAESLRNLRVDHIDYFFLHEPAQAPTGRHDALVELLDTAQRASRITHWGLAGDLSELDRQMSELSDRASAHQYPYDIAGGPRFSPPGRGPATTIVFGFLSGGLPYLAKLLSEQPGLRDTCSELLDADLGDRRNIARFVVRNAMAENESSVVLLGSTRIDHLGTLCEAARTPFSNETEVADLIRRHPVGVATL